MKQKHCLAQSKKQLRRNSPRVHARRFVAAWPMFLPAMSAATLAPTQKLRPPSANIGYRTLLARAVFLEPAIGLKNRPGYGIFYQ